MTFNYIASCQEPTAVTASTSCCLISPNEVNLIVAKYTRLEIYSVSSFNLELILKTSVSGHITNLASFKHKNSSKDFLIMLTEKLDVSILEYHQTDKIISTRCSGKITDSLKKSNGHFPVLCVSPSNDYALIKIFNGLIKLFPLDFRREGPVQMYSIRLNELYATDLTFLPSPKSDTLQIGLIYQDRLSKNLRTYFIATSDKEIRDGAWSLSGIEDASSVIISYGHKSGGLVVVGKNNIVHVDSHGTTTSSPPSLRGNEPIHVYTQICKGKNPTFLLADGEGNLYILTVCREVYITFIGTVGFTSTLSYLGNGIVFVGSSISDSFLIQIHKDLNNSSYITVLETFTNIGPIIDMEVFNRHQEVPRLITCSGTDRWGSLRILTNGVKIRQLRSISLSRFNNVFALKLSLSSKDNALLFTSSRSSVILLESGLEFQLFSHPSFSYSKTLYIGNVLHSQILQITDRDVRLIRVSDLAVLQTLDLHPLKVLTYSCTGWQFAISVGTTISFYNINKGKFEGFASHDFKREISCISIFTLKNLSCEIRSTCFSDFADTLAVAFWDYHCLELYSISDFELKAQDIYDRGAHFRSLQLIQFKQNVVYLLAAMGSGDLFLYDMSNPECLLMSRANTHLSTSPLDLVCVRLKGNNLPLDLVPGCENIISYGPLGEPVIFTCSDRSSIVYYNSFKLSFSYLNSEDVISCCSYDSAYFSNCFVVTSKNSVSICRITDICTYNVQSIPIFESPRKIVYQRPTNSIGLLTVRKCSKELSENFANLPSNQKPFSMRKVSSPYRHKFPKNDEYDISSFVVINQDTYDPMCLYSFPLNEMGCALATCDLNFHMSPLYAVGTGMIASKDVDPKRGRVILFQYCEDNLVQVSDYQAKGAVFCIHEHKGRLFCCVNHCVIMLLLRSDNELVCPYEVNHHVTSLYCKSLNNTLLVGDLIKGLTVYNTDSLDSVKVKYKSSENNWVTAVEIIDDNHFLYSNIEGGLFISRGECFTGTTTQPLLTVILAYNIDQQVNVFKAQKLQSHRSFEGDLQEKSCVMFATVSGMIGTILHVPSPWDEILKIIQKHLVQNMESLGDIDYNTWRSSSFRKFSPTQSFLDGDLLDTFITSCRNQILPICKNLEEYFPNLSMTEISDRVSSFILDLSGSLPLIKSPS